MTARQPNQPDQVVARLPNDRSEIDRLEEGLVAAVEREGYPPAAQFALRLALDEAILNAFRHGHRELPHLPIQVSYRVESDRVRITVEDQGPGFSPDEVPDPTLDENIERSSGRGLMLIRAYMSEVEFNDRGNRLSMIYVRPRPAKSATIG